jgi:hypothetical protein
MRPPTKLHVFVNFWPKKCYNPLSAPYSPDLSPPDCFLFPKFKMKLKNNSTLRMLLRSKKRNWWINKVQKEEFSAAFRKLYDRAKACIYANGAYFEFKKVMSLPHVSSIFNKISPRTFGPHCILLNLLLYISSAVSKANVVLQSLLTFPKWYIR